MLSDLRKKSESEGRKISWKKDTVKGLCANKGCMEISSKECIVCGIRYCCSVCQKEDWRARHKHFCKPKDLRRTEIIFDIFRQRLVDYKSGKTSLERYVSIGSMEIYNDTERSGKNGPFKNMNCDEVSGRVVTFLTQNEIDDYNRNWGNAICRSQSGGEMQKLFLINHHSPTNQCSEQNEIKRIVRDSIDINQVVELVPFNKSYQKKYFSTIFASVLRAARYALWYEQNTSIGAIELLITPGW